MKRILSSRWFRLSGKVALVLVIAVLWCAWYFRVWSWHDVLVYQMMRRECHPVWKDLHWGRVHAGQNVEEVIATTKPTRVERYGDFVQLSYQEGLCFSGVTITAKSGRLANAAAWSCTWNREFFNELTQSDWQSFSDASEEHWQSIGKRRDEAERAAAPDHGGM